jgi:NADP-dependent 3-hydroxy acid dehydrogenase YdfG
VPRWLTANDVADAVLWMVTRPAHVVIAELVMMASGQGR